MPAVSQLPASVQAHSQLSIMNTTFCYAAILHLYRRVMNLPSYSPMVQNIVKHNTKLLTRHIPLGSPVEACMSFPVFTIACEVLEHDQETRKNTGCGSREWTGLVLSKHQLHVKWLNDAGKKSEIGLM